MDLKDKPFHCEIDKKKCSLQCKCLWILLSMFHRLKLSRNNYLPYLRGLSSPISTEHGAMFLYGNIDCINPL